MDIATNKKRKERQGSVEKLKEREMNIPTERERETTPTYYFELDPAVLGRILHVVYSTSKM